MNGSYDIERALDRWYQTGPTTAPEDSVERALARALDGPQVRPLPLPGRRIRSNRAASLVAAIVAVVVVAVALSFGPWRDPAVIGPATSGPSPSITPTPRPSPTQSPDDVPDPPTSRTEISTLFTSELYGYSIAYPIDWKPVPATKSGTSDTITAPSPSTTRLSIVRRALPAGTTFAAAAESAMPHRARGDGCHWQSSGIIFIPAAQDIFRETEIAGRPALVRSECSFVDAAIELDGEVLFVVLESGRRMPTGDRSWFDRFAEWLIIDDTSVASPTPAPTPTPTTSDPAAEPSQVFTSELYGYSIHYPIDWIPTGPAFDGGSDEITAPAPLALTRLSIVRRSMPLARSLTDAAESALPHRGAPCTWQTGGTLFLAGAWDTFHETLIAGHPAVVRSECGFVDAAIQLSGGEVLLVILRSHQHTLTGDRSTFDRFVETLRIEDPPA